MKTHTIMAKRIIFLLLFALLCGLLVFAISCVLEPKSDLMAAFYAEPTNSIEVLFIGGSHSAAAFNPSQLWNEYGIVAYNLYSWAQPMWTSYHYLVEALKTQNPKVVVLEGFPLVYGNTYLQPADMSQVSDDFSLQIKPGVNRFKLMLAMSRYQTNARPFYRYFPIFRYHRNWETFTLKDIGWFFQNHRSSHRGFGPVYGAEPFTGHPEPLPAQGPVTMFEGSRLYMNKILDLAEKEGFQLVVAVTPYIVEYEAEWLIYEQVTAELATKGVPLLNYLAGSSLDESGFSFATDMAEHAHVNPNGAAKLTSHIGKFLSMNYDLIDHRGDASFAEFAQVAEREAWEAYQMNLRLAPDMASYFQLLNHPRLAAALVTRGDAFADGTGLVGEVLKGWGISPEMLEENQGEMAAVISNGGLLEFAQGRTQEYSDAGLTFFLQAGEGGRIELAGEVVSIESHDDCILLVVWDKESGKIIQSVAFFSDEQWKTYTD